MHDAASREVLARAFSGFERAALRLREQQRSLERQVRLLERRLEGAQRQLGTVVDALDSGIAVLAADGRVLRANRAFERLTRRSPHLAREIQEALQRGTVSRGITLAVTGDGARGKRELSVTLFPSGDDQGTLVLTAHDVTDIRREEQEDGRRQRLESLGRMAAELAHEVRNPVGSIRLLAGLLHDDLADRPAQREMADQILEASSRLEGVVTNLLSFASPPRHSHRAFDLARLARETCAMLEPSCVVRGVHLNGPDRSCEMHGDPEALRQVVLNLIGNALAATPERGRIDVQVGQEGEHAVLIVEDDGAGIAEEDLRRVFEPFFTRTEGGTGLGLSVVQRIVERHGGKIHIDSAEGRGTRARVELPLRPFEELS